jgi:DNA polymerase-3 subunit gamma/tau
MLDGSGRPHYSPHVSYRVFARKYRPQTFDEVVGQEHITRTLQNAVASNRLAQAYLFVGPRGIGKTSTARILAKALNCVEGPTTTPCGVCDACREITEGRSLDVIEIDGASNNGVENIRDLRDNAAYAPARGPFKIYLIDEVHMLSTGAFNALLKTLEEPPPHVKFIFATTEAQKLPATITSRCQRFDLRRIPAKAIARHLAFIAGKEKIDLDPAAADAIARGAEGGLRDAESMLDQMVAFCGTRITAADVMDVFGFTAMETVTALAERIFDHDATGALAIVSEQSEAGKDISRLTAELISHLRDLLITQATGAPTSIPQGKLLDLIDHFSETESRMKWVSDKKLQLDVAVIKALHLLDETSLTDVIETLASLREGGDLPAPAGKPAEPRRPVTKSAAPAQKSRVEEAKPEAAPASGEDPDAAAVSAIEAWESVAAQFAKESMIRFGWLRDGVFERFESNELVVRFPHASREASESIFMEKGRKDIEKALGQTLKLPVRITLEFEEAAPLPPEVEPYPVETPEPPATPPQPGPVDDYRNDPFIKKALEIFKGRLQTSAR